MPTETQFQTLVRYVEDYKLSSVGLGAILAHAKENYEEMVGEGITNWHDFLAQPEIGLSVREANGLIKLEEWCHKNMINIRDVNLSIAKFAAQKGITDPELFEDMKVLSVKDFKDRHHEVKTKDKPQTYTYLVMKRSNETGTLSRVYGVEDLEKDIAERMNE